MSDPPILPHIGEVLGRASSPPLTPHHPIRLPRLLAYSPLSDIKALPTMHPPTSPTLEMRTRGSSPLSTMSSGSSRLSSPLSSPLSDLASRSPSPAPSLNATRPSIITPSRRPASINTNNYPTPPSTQDSQPASPRDSDDSVCSSSTEQDGPPAKRRRMNSMGPRETKRLDLDDFAANQDPEQHAEIERLIKGLKTKRKIVVVAGAGISVSAGIPDFRSSHGLFKSLKAEHKIKGSGKSLFDADVYRDDKSTTSFHAMVRGLSKSTKEATPTLFHHLLARLAREGRLLRLYTQNVDGIDTSMEPLKTEVPLPRKGPWPKTVQLHGGLDKMVCTKCGALRNFDADIFDGPNPPECSQCLEVDKLRTEVAGKRSHGVGRMRPRMVLYNEPNPDDEAIGSVAKADMRRRPDALIVVGTTMKIPGVRRIVREMSRIVRDHRDGLSVWINNDPEPSGVEFKDAWDIIVKGKSDTIAEIADLGRWDAPEHDLSAVSDEQMQDVMIKSNPAVVVSSQEAASIHLPSPEMTDGESTASVLGYTEAKVKNPATTGKTIQQILLDKSKAPSKRAGAKGKLKGPPKSRSGSKPAQSRISVSFKTSKTSTAATIKANKKVTVRGKENVPPPKAASPTKIKQQQQPSTPSKKLSASRPNTPAKSPIKFPNLLPPSLKAT